MTPLSLEEVFKVFAQVRVHLRLRTIQLEFLKTQMSLVYGFFALFPGWKKVRRESECGAAPGGQLMDSGGLWGPPSPVCLDPEVAASSSPVRRPLRLVAYGCLSRGRGTSPLVSP